jgi:xyloglucan-specific endo-beta-1,4-glucanase
MYSTSLTPKLLALLATALAVAAAPSPSKVLAPPSEVERSPAAITSFCGQWDTATTSDFILYNDLWGESSATSGSQCTTLESSNGNTIVWQTAWTWEGGSSGVKSYANAVLNSGAVQLGSISSIPVTWKWR